MAGVQPNNLGRLGPDVALVDILSTVENTIMHHVCYTQKPCIIRILHYQIKACISCNEHPKSPSN